MFLASAKKDDDWGGTEVTLQMDVAKPNQDENGEWDGTEATLQNMDSRLEMKTGTVLKSPLQNMDSGDWDGSEATLQNLPAQQTDEDSQSTKSGTGSRTQATFVRRNDDGTPTDPTSHDRQGRTSPKQRAPAPKAWMPAGI